MPVDVAGVTEEAVGAAAIEAVEVQEVQEAPRRAAVISK